MRTQDSEDEACTGNPVGVMECWDDDCDTKIIGTLTDLYEHLMKEHPMKTRVVAREEFDGKTWKEVLKEERSRLLKQRINNEMVVNNE